ncbi:SUKH-3 domain-containing protein [Streptomyces sp. SID11385]|uniref:SUKH-3 domain-containing protein n=1 Tax=Streptomyces sp. SID11385 TaxID=2706031 RepID=UPI0013C8C5FA|nr:SUKH-3 domain-containing protein [Streptomyces sp. SID11385]NEA42276.1 hypothetical protein [Streptomyces sp. SID11385]
MNKFSLDGEALRILQSAGWRADRSVDVSGWEDLFRPFGINMHASARNFLSSFGGISVDVRGPGISRAREPFAFDPAMCVGDEDLYLEWGEELNRRFYPIGALDDGRYALGVDEGGGVYSLESWVGYFGQWEKGVESLVLGIVAAEIA